MSNGTHVMNFLPLFDRTLDNIFVRPNDPLTIAYLERELDPPHLFSQYEPVPLDFVSEKIREDVERTWRKGVARATAAGKTITNNPLPNIQRISEEDSKIVIGTNLTTYKSSYGIKLRPERYDFDTEANIARYISPLNIGVILGTSDNRIIAATRPAGLTAENMVLNLPCGYVYVSDTSLKAALNRQAKTEVGIKVYKEEDGQVSGELESHIVKPPAVLGIEWESAELTPILTMAIKTDYTSRQIREFIIQTKRYEVDKVITISAHPLDLTGYLIRNYAPSLGFREMSIPNLTAMALFYLGYVDHELFYQTVADIRREARTRYVTQFDVREYSLKANPWSSS